MISFEIAAFALVMLGVSACVAYVIQARREAVVRFDQGAYIARHTLRRARRLANSSGDPVAVHHMTTGTTLAIVFPR